MLAFGQLIAVTKFATGPQILERYEMCATHRVRGLSRNGARYSFNSYNSWPFKNCMSSGSGDYFSFSLVTCQPQL